MNGYLTKLLNVFFIFILSNSVFAEPLIKALKDSTSLLKSDSPEVKRRGVKTRRFLI